MRLLIATLLVTTLFATGSTPMERTVERTLAVSGPIELNLGTHSGGIVVRRGSDGAVRVRCILQGHPRAQKGFSEGDIQARLQQLESNPPIEQIGNRILVGKVPYSTTTGVSVRIEIEAPAAIKLTARAHSGAVRIENINGPVHCHTDSGSVELEEIKSAVQIKTDSGAIHARRIAGAIDAATDSGAIDLEQTIVGPVEATTGSGKVLTKLVPGAAYTFNVSSRRGKISITDLTPAGEVTDKRVRATVHGGGPTVKIATGSGNIEIRVASGGGMHDSGAGSQPSARVSHGAPSR